MFCKSTHTATGNPAPPFVRNIFTLGTCSEISGANVIPCQEEATLLQHWSDFVQEVDPDLIIGYNTTGFDLPYLLARAKALQVHRFPFLGRLKRLRFFLFVTILFSYPALIFQTPKPRAREP
jgi:DNA polymerase elongation subunit (family B)